MPYNEFTFDLLSERLGITIQDAPGLFAQVPPLASSTRLKEQMAIHLPLLGGLTTEKARSELAIMPVLVEAREIVGRTVALFSGAEFTVDREKGLFGYCDFLISHTSTLMAVGAPVIAIVEAKREDLISGVPQCVAEMYAAQIFNQRREKPLSALFGVVTSGTLWRFLKMEGPTVFADTTDFFIEDMDRILGVLVHMIRSADTPTATTESLVL